MMVPTPEEFRLPLLVALADGAERNLKEASELVAGRLNLTPEQRAELAGKSGQPRYRNQTYWAKLYLSKARLIESTGPGRIRITERGRSVLAQAPPVLDKTYLRQFPEFVEFLRSRRATQAASLAADGEATSETPEEHLESSFESIRSALAAEVLERLYQCSPEFFERIVVDVLVAMGYGGSREDAGRAIGRTGDEGIDGVIKEDKLGLDFVLIQAKRWKAPVGAPTVRDFAGSLEGKRADKGVLITTSRFTPDATEYVSKIGKRIVLIDGEQLAELMIDHNVGVIETARYVLKRIDSDYFGEE